MHYSLSQHAGVRICMAYVREHLAQLSPAPVIDPHRTSNNVPIQLRAQDVLRADQLLPLRHIAIGQFRITEIIERAVKTPYCLGRPVSLVVGAPKVKIDSVELWRSLWL